MTIEPGATRERLVTGPFIAVTTALFLQFMFVGMVIVIIPRFVELHLGAGEFGIGLTLVAFAGAAVACRPAIGPLSDRFGRRALMRAGALMCAGAALLAGLSPNLGVFLALRAVMGVGEAVVFVAASSLIADLSPEGRRAEGASYLSVAVFTGVGIGPLVGEWFLGDDHYTRTFVAAAVFAVIGALSVFRVPPRVDRVAEGPPRRFILLHRAALWPGVVLACAIASFASFGAFVPDHARSVGLAGAGGLFAVYSGVSLVIRIFGARIPEMIGLRTSASVALASLAVGLALLAAVPSAWALWLAAGITGAGMALNYPPLWARVVDSVEPHERTAAVSSFTMFFEVGNIVGGLSLGIVAELAGKRSGFAGGVVMALIGLVVVWTMLPERNPAHAEAPTMPSAPIR